MDLGAVPLLEVIDQRVVEVARHEESHSRLQKIHFVHSFTQ
jgi:hypothetical protein